MADTTIIREFLATLGFDVDEAKLKKFGESLDKVTERVAAMGAGIEAAEKAVEAAVVVIAQGFEQLAHASDRLHASVSNIQAFAYAISQMGGSSEGAISALEAFSSWVRRTPNWEGMMARMNIATRGANGQLRDTTDIFKDLGDRLRGMEMPRAEVIAEMLGIDDRTLLALRQGGAAVDKWMQQIKGFDKVLGFNEDGAAGTAVQFSQAVRQLQTELSHLIDKIALDLLQRYGPMLQNFLTWLANNAPLVEKRIEDFANGLIRLAMNIVKFITPIWNFFVRLDKATHGLSTNLILIGAALKMSGLLGLAGQLLPLIMEFPEVAAAIAAVAAAIAWLTDDYARWQQGLSHTVAWEQVIPLVLRLRDALVLLWRAVGTAFGALMSAIGQLLQVLGPILTPVITNVAKIFLLNLVYALTVATVAVVTMRETVQLLIDTWREWQALKSGDLQGFQAAAASVRADMAAGDRDIIASLKNAYHATRDMFSPGGGGPALPDGSGTPQDDGRGGYPVGHVAPLAVQQGGNAASGGPWGTFSTDPDNEPKAGVRASRDLKASIDNLSDQISGGAGGSGLDGLAKAMGLGEGGDPKSGGGDGSAAPASSLPRIKTIGQAIMSTVGLSAAGVGGALSNFYAESGVRGINERRPAIPGSRGGFGYAQWTGPRRREFEAWASQNGLDPSSDAANIGFFAYDLRTHFPELLRFLQSTTDPNAAASAIFRYFEGGVGSAAAHMRNANRFASLMDDSGRAAPILNDAGYRRGGHHSTHSQTNHITVQTSDPYVAAEKTSLIIERKYGDLVRNTKPALT